MASGVLKEKPFLSGSAKFEKVNLPSRECEISTKKNHQMPTETNLIL